jgi:hypothetical protein
MVYGFIYTVPRDEIQGTGTNATVKQDYLNRIIQSIINYGYNIQKEDNYYVIYGQIPLQKALTNTGHYQLAQNNSTNIITEIIPIARFKIEVNPHNYGGYHPVYIQLEILLNMYNGESLKYKSHINSAIKQVFKGEMRVLNMRNNNNATIRYKPTKGVNVSNALNVEMSDNDKNVEMSNGGKRRSKSKSKRRHTKKHRKTRRRA